MSCTRLHVCLHLLSMCASERNLQDTLAMPPLEELDEKQAETDFGAATCGLTILRYLTGE